MRILMGIPFLYPAVCYGGAARAAYYLAESLSLLGHQVTVLTTDVWDATSRWKPNGIQAPFEVIRVRNLSNRMAYYWQFYTPLGVLKHAERLLAESDVLHLHTFRNLLNDLLARTAVKQGVPYLLTGHGTIPRKERFFLIKRAYDFLIGKWQLQNASGYIAVSKAEQAAMTRFGIPDKKIRVIPNGIHQIPPAARGAFRQRWRIHENEKIILFVGRITRQKGLQHVVGALSDMRKEVRLIISGNDMGYEGKIRGMISELGLRDRVLWTGVLDDEQKHAAFADSDLTVYPSRKEVFGLVPLESILCGTPVIVSGDGGCGEVIRRTGGGDLVPWGDKQALVYTIRKRLRAGKDAEELQKAQENIRLHFNRYLIAREILNFYHACGNE
jgi:glycosyltransferase involved in cell wall biosynthesis